MSVLDSIITGVKEDLSTRKSSMPLSELEGQIPTKSAGVSQNVYSTLTDGSFHIISEVKRSSPSKGSLAHIADPAALAQCYERGGASVISVLTEERRFNGSLADLDAVTAAVKVPVLRKDFMVDPYQFFEAKAHGASVVLLIVAALSQEQLKEFLALSRQLDLAALVETHTVAEMERAMDAKAPLVGVNTRNLKTLEVNPNVFAEVAQAARPGMVLVAESGVNSAKDVELYAHAGAHAALIGEALVKESEPEAAVERMKNAGQQSLTYLKGKHS